MYRPDDIPRHPGQGSPPESGFSTPRQLRWRGRLPAFLVAVFYAALTLAVCWPAPVRPRQLILGHPGNDTWNHVWGFWWVAREILQEGRWPGWTDLIAWPTGGALYFIDTMNALATLPAQALAGPVVSYNLVFMGSIWFSAMGGWFLARHLVKDPLPAVPAGLLFGFSPHLLAQAHNGITETLNAGWLAIYLLALIRLVERPSWGRGALAWATLVLCGLFNWYYALFAMLATVVLLGVKAAQATYPVPWWVALKRSVPGALVFVPLGLLGLLLLQRSMDAPDALVNRDPEFVWNSLIYHNMSDVVSFFRPGRVYSPDLEALYGESLIIVTYLGWVALLIAGWGLLRERHRRDHLPWVVMALVFWLFSLGPYLFVAGDYVELAGRRIPLPFLTFFEAFPLFSRISHPFRFVVGVELALGMLVALSLATWARRRGRRAAMPAALVISAVMLAEIWFCSPAVLPMPTSQATTPGAYAVIRDDSREGAVLDLPVGVPLLERAVYNWYQVEHGRPIPYTLNEPMPPGLRSNQLVLFILALEAGRARLLPRTLPDLELVLSSRILARQGYRWIVVHDPLYPEVKRRQVHTVLAALLGPPVERDDQITVYELP